MGKLLKFLKPYAGAVVAIICILVVQAYCDLSLPTYTSDIVNVGIQQGGIDETVPDTISKKDLNHLLLLVPSDKQELVKNAYTKSTKKYDYKGTVMELKSSVKEDDKKMEKLSDILGKPMLLAAGFDSGSDMTQRIEDQMRTNMKKQVEAKQAEAKAQMEKAQKEAEDKINAQFADALAAAQTPGGEGPGARPRCRQRHNRYRLRCRKHKRRQQRRCQKFRILTRWISMIC